MVEEEAQKIAGAHHSLASVYCCSSLLFLPVQEAKVSLTDAQLRPQRGAAHLSTMTAGHM